MTTPSTPAIRFLRARGVVFTQHTYRHEAHGGTRAASRALGVAEHAVVKTLVLEDEAGEPLMLLMHGDREVSLRGVARQLGRKRIAMCDSAAARRHTGYRLGGTSPFGTRRPLPIFAEKSILELPRIFINGGSRGLLVGLAAAELSRVLEPTPLEVARG